MCRCDFTVSAGTQVNRCQDYLARVETCLHFAISVTKSKKAEVFMSAYALEATKEVTKEVPPVSPVMKKIILLLEHIEEMKRKIVVTEFNERMPIVIKKHRLDEMRTALKQVEAHTIGLMSEALGELADESNDGGGV